MKRNMDLVRSILLETEKADSSYDAGRLVCEAYSIDEIYYHVELMQAHGLIDAVIQKDWNGSVVLCRIEALTWDGCDYLDAIRDNGIWARTKKAVAETVGSTTMSAIKEIAVMIAVQAVKAAVVG